METFRVIHSRYFVDFQAPEADLHGRTCIITGANTGVGYEAALHLAKRNASVIILAVRSVSKGQAAVEQLHAACPTYEGKIEVWELDMASFANVIAFGKRCVETLPRLDIAILNAGVVSFNYAKTGDGWEQLLQVNVLSTGLLGLMLLPKLSETASVRYEGGGTAIKPHLVIVSSDTHYIAAFACRKTSASLLDALNDPKNFGMDTYQITKLLEIYLAREMIALPSASGVVVNTVNPGLTKSSLRRDTPSLFRSFFDGLAWPTEKGSRNYIYAALTDTSPAAFISLCKERAPASLVTNAEGQKIQKKFWSEVTDLYRSVAPGIDLGFK